MTSLSSWRALRPVEGGEREATEVDQLLVLEIEARATRRMLAGEPPASPVRLTGRVANPLRLLVAALAAIFCTGLARAAAANSEKTRTCPVPAPTTALILLRNPGTAPQTGR